MAKLLLVFIVLRATQMPKLAAFNPVAARPPPLAAQRQHYAMHTQAVAFAKHL